MIESARKSLAVRWPLAVVAAVTIAAIVMLRPSTASAVEYVKVCSLYGAGYFYLPGTDTCIDVATNDARQGPRAAHGIGVPRIIRTPGRRLPRMPARTANSSSSEMLAAQA